MSDQTQKTVSELLEDRVAEEMSLTLCEFRGECDFCRTPEADAKVWAAIDYGEVTETSYYVCAKCLPDHYQKWLQERRNDEAFAVSEEELLREPAPSVSDASKSELGSE